jgi:hypothetical protein
MCAYLPAWQGMSKDRYRHTGQEDVWYLRMKTLDCANRDLCNTCTELGMWNSSMHMARQPGVGAHVCA